MKYKFELTEDARFDIKDTSDWYEAKQKGLGKRFMISVKECTKLIIKNPNMYGIVFLDIHKANINVFPYSIYFEVDNKNKEIKVFAVISQSRSEKVWQERIE